MLIPARTPSVGNPKSVNVSNDDRVTEAFMNAASAVAVGGEILVRFCWSLYRSRRAVDLSAVRRA
jgi:hypothetical protein